MNTVNVMSTKQRNIYRWMKSNVCEHVDECGEVDLTALVETWDEEQGSGHDTLDPNHEAWEMASYVAENYTG